MREFLWFFLDMAFQGRKFSFSTVEDIARLGIAMNYLGQDEVWKAIETVASLVEMDPIAMAVEVASRVFNVSEELMKDATQGEFGSKTKVALIAIVEYIETSPVYKPHVGLLFVLGDFGKGLYDLMEADKEETDHTMDPFHTSSPDELNQTIDGAVRKSFELLARFGLNNKSCKEPDGVKNAYNAAKAEYHPTKGTYPNKRNWIRHYSAAQFLNTERGKAFLKKKQKKTFF